MKPLIGWGWPGQAQVALAHADLCGKPMRKSRLVAACTALASLMMMAWAWPAIAQVDAADDLGGAVPEALDPGATSYFKMFLTSEDVIGQMIIILLVLMSMLSISLTIYYSLQARRNAMMPESTLTRLRDLLASKRYRDAIDFARTDESFVGRICYASLHEASQGFDAMERALEEAADLETTRALRPVETLNILGSVSPMIGLFGTVYGMIVAFQDLVAAEGRPDPAQLAAGISTALVTTLWGLVVAIPAIAAYALIRNRIDALSAEALIATDQLLESFRRKRAAPASDTAGQASSRAGGAKANRGQSGGQAAGQGGNQAGGQES